MLFFPDPWHKKRHHKRRIVRPDFLNAVAHALMPDGLLHCATDVTDYATWMHEHLAADNRFANTAAGCEDVVRPDWRPATRFERRGERLGHSVHDLLYRRCYLGHGRDDHWRRTRQDRPDGPTRTTDPQQGRQDRETHHSTGFGHGRLHLELHAEHRCCRAVPATFGLFSVTPIGLALVVAGIVYFVVAGRLVLPRRSNEDTTKSSRAADYFESVYGIKGELLEVRVTDDSSLVGKTIRQVENSDNAPNVLALYSGDVVKVPPDREEMIWVNTRLGLMGDRKQVEAWCLEHDWEVKGEPDRFADVLNAQHGGVAEIVIPPGSSLIGKEIKDIKPRRNLGTNILQIYRTEQIITHNFGAETLRAGDTLVVYASWKDLAKLQRTRGQDLVLATDVKYEALRTNKIRPDRVFARLAYTARHGCRQNGHSCLDRTGDSRDHRRRACMGTASGGRRTCHLLHLGDVQHRCHRAAGTPSRQYCS